VRYTAFPERAQIGQFTVPDNGRGLEESIGCWTCTPDGAAVAWRARARRPPACCRLRGGYPGVFPNNTAPHPPAAPVTAIRTNTCLSGTAHTAWRTGGNGRHRCAQTPAAPPARAARRSERGPATRPPVHGDRQLPYRRRRPPYRPSDAFPPAPRAHVRRRRRTVVLL